MPRLKLLALTLPLLAAGPALAVPQGDTVPAGDMRAVVDGRPVALPMLKSDFDVAIAGDVATVTVRQTFANPGDRPVDATYLFPLGKRAAVHAMEMRVGDTVVRAVIQEKAKARATFDKAKAAGKQAALLTQHRPNMFTQSVANLMPGAPIEVTLRYVQTVPKVEGEYQLVMPMVVGPRHERVPDMDVVDHRDPNRASDAPKTDQIDGWSVDRLPAYPPVIGQSAPATIDPRRVSLKVSMTAPTGIASVASETHRLTIEKVGESRTIGLAKGKAIDNRDFVVRYRLGEDAEIAAGALSHFDERGGFVSLMLEPPRVTDEATVTPRELVFVLDTSGSMNGAPMEASRRFMQAALKGLRPSDSFRILSFSNATRHMAARALPATPGNVRRGLAYVGSLRAGGGTEMERALHGAFDTAQPAGTSRIVIFLTDGYIGADREVIRAVANRVGDARIYAFGVGRSVNRFLLDGMAEEGRGYVRYIDPGEDHMEAAETLARDLKSPLLTDIRIDWNGLQVEGQSPARLPDLFAGGSLRVAARYAKGGQHTVYVEGMVQGRKARLPVALDLAEAPVERAADATAHPLPLIWARERIATLNRDYTLAGGSPKLKAAITRLGLDFSLQSRFTSFVAVSDKVVNPDRSDTVDAQVPLPQASGVPKEAYPNGSRTRARGQLQRALPAIGRNERRASTRAFDIAATPMAESFAPGAAPIVAGASTPEPETLAAIALVALLALARWWRTVRARLSATLRRLTTRRRRAAVPDRMAEDGWWLAGTSRGSGGGGGGEWVKGSQ